MERTQLEFKLQTTLLALNDKVVCRMELDDTQSCLGNVFLVRSSPRHYILQRDINMCEITINARKCTLQLQQGTVPAQFQMDLTKLPSVMNIQVQEKQIL